MTLNETTEIGTEEGEEWGKREGGMGKGRQGEREGGSMYKGGERSRGRGREMEIERKRHRGMLQGVEAGESESEACLVAGVREH